MIFPAAAVAAVNTISGSSAVSLVVSSIPSPSSNNLKLGPITLNYYGLCIGIGVLVAIYIAQRRWVARGGDPEDIASIATWTIPAGLIGARVYHLITDWRPIDVWLKVWEGGLGIPGGLVAGMLAGVWAAKRRNVEISNALDAIIPAVPVAQAIGRLGNWFNQEIFGRPTDVPWGVEIDEVHRPAEFASDPAFHPAFLYEALWNLGLAGFLVWIDRRGVLKRGMILPLYIGGYGIGRFVVEGVRIDPATLILGVRVNHWVSGLAVVFSALALMFLYKNAKLSFWASDADDKADSASNDDDSDADSDAKHEADELEADESEADSSADDGDPADDADSETVSSDG